MCGSFIGLICFNTNMDNIENLEGEIWKDVKDWEGIYKISNKGRLASSKSGKWNVLSNVNSKGGYLSVVLQYNGKRKYARIHRLVYETFVKSIPKGKRHHVHHKDGNKQNNALENLEFVDATIHYELHYGKHRQIPQNFIRTKSKKTCQIHKKREDVVQHKQPKRGYKINQYDLKGNYINTYISAANAGKLTGVCKRNILQVANKEPFNKKGNIRKQAGGYIWRFAE